MKNVFVKTKNVKNFISLMDNLQKLPSNIPKLALVYGDHGFGKTNAIIWWATRNDAIYVRANNEMTQGALLKFIVEELGERPFYLMQENYNLILRHLKQNPQIIIVDETDYLIGNKNVIEILRDIQDNTGAPIVLVGMGVIDKKIARYRHFDDRIFQKLKFEHFNEEDIREILSELTELNFTEINHHFSNFCSGKKSTLIQKIMYFLWHLSCVWSLNFACLCVFVNNCKDFNIFLFYLLTLNR